MANINSTIENLNSTSSVTKSTSLSENMVQINYDGVLSICDNMTRIVQDIVEQLKIVEDIYNNKSNTWKGTAANKFFNEMKTKYNEMYKFTENTIPKYLTTVQELVEQNKKTDSQIVSSDLELINLEFPTITSVSTSTSLSTINDTSSANDNIQSTSTDAVASTITDETVNSVNANNNVQSTSADVTTSTITDETINSVNINNDISSNTTDAIAMSLEDIVKNTK